MADLTTKHLQGLLLVLLVLVVASSKLIYAFALSPLRRIPGPAWARITTLRAIRNRLPKNVVQAALGDFRTYGDIYVSRPDTVTISNPKDVRAVLGSIDSWKIDIYKGLDDPVMRNLVTFSHPQLASRRRRQIGPYLNNASYLTRMEEVVLRHGAEALVHKWEARLSNAGQSKVEINYRNDTQLATFNIMSALAFGRVDSTWSDASIIVDWIAATAVYVGISINFKALLNFPFSYLLRRWLQKYQDFVKYGQESVAQRREALSQGVQDKPADMLQAFIDAEDPDSKLKMTPVEVHAESVGMQLAGSETTSASLTWAFHLLTLYPKVLDRAVDEIRAQFSAHHLITYWDCRQHLPFLESFVYETFRYAPITSGFMPRRSKKALLLQGHRIPAGTNIAFNLMAINNRPDIWDRPEEFEPERFLANEDAKREIFAFSYGPRSCIGRNLAWMEIMSILANILNRFDIELPEDAIYGPHNLNSQQIPVMMPSQCHIVFAPQQPERDCRLLVSTRV
jgi:cytochrome P450